MKIIQEFKEFAVKGNMIDLAIGVIIGGAFSKIVTSLVGDIVTPLLGIILGNINFADRVLEVAGAKVAYGAFIQNVIDFLLTAIVIFFFIKLINRFRRKAEAPPATKVCQFCTKSIPIKATRCPECTSQLAQ